MMFRVAHIMGLTSLLMLGLMAGFFYGFSVCVMPGLDDTDPQIAISAMQAINTAVRNPVFFVTFFLTPVVSLVSAVLYWKAAQNRVAIIMAAAALAYVAGVIVPTSMVNVPMNEALGLIDLAALSDSLQQVWVDYSKPWTHWNTMRTIVTSVSLLLCGTGLFVAGAGKAD